MVGTYGPEQPPRTASREGAALTQHLWRPILAVVVQAVALLGSAGTLAWPAAWIYVGLYLGVVVVGAALLQAHDPDLAWERAEGSRGGERWDTWVTRAMGVAWLGTLVTAGFDERLGWSPPLPLPLGVGGAVFVVAGYALTTWAMYVNTFFTVTVRIQPERGHTVVCDGPYAYVRHPGYAGMLMSMLGAVFLLGSLWALIPWVLLLAVNVVRVVLEERTLTGGLAGYPEYVARTRYRLLPLVW